MVKVDSMEARGRRIDGGRADVGDNDSPERSVEDRERVCGERGDSGEEAPWRCGLSAGLPRGLLRGLNRGEGDAVTKTSESRDSASESLSCNRGMILASGDTGAELLSLFGGFR